VIRTPIGTIRRDGASLAVIFEREFTATPDEIWAALADSHRLARWFARPVGTLAVGQTVRLILGDEPGQYADLRIDACAAPERIEGEWTFPGEPSTTLRVTLRPLDNGKRTHLMLENTGFPPTRTAGYGCGWHHYVDSLDAHLRDAEPPSFADYHPAMLDTYRAAVTEATGGTA
jgi:uncharacterized protein YndB with AHSA1/START domain